MSTRDLLLIELYRTPRDAQTLALVARHAPVLYFDAREPFLPLAAGYSLFTQDSPSPSFRRNIELRPEGKPPAALAIEYAIWWDWDIHHLYELEHVWVYLDAQGQPVRVEGSWHGKYYELPLTLESGRAVLLSEPGKHAFAPHPDWFQKRRSEFRRVETSAVGVHANVLINELFAGRIREQVFDQVLVRSFLTSQAFTPAWNFSQRYQFQSDSLVPWESLKTWIPQRVNAWLSRLETNIKPEQYQPLLGISGNGTLAGLRSAASAGADAVMETIELRENRLMLAGGALSLDEALGFCSGEPMGAFLRVTDAAAVDRLAWFVRTNELQRYAVVTSPDTRLLAQYAAFVNGSVITVQLVDPQQDPIEAARACRALLVNPLWGQPGAEWIERVHQAGLGVLSAPLQDSAQLPALKRTGLDAIWLDPSGSTQIEK